MEDMMISDNEFDSAWAKTLERAVTRWENEGGAKGNRDPDTNQATIVGEVGDAEEVNIRVRLIALENIVVALLASDAQDVPELVREMAQYISPRSEATPHRLTIEAARNMLAIVERAEHCRGENVAMSRC
jgi:hypothetical protein